MVAGADWALNGDTTICSGQTLTDAGTLTVTGTLSGTGATIVSGGQELVAAGGSVVNTDVEAGGVQTVEAGGTDSTATIAGEQDVFGSGSGATVLSGGLQQIESSGVATGTTVESAVRSSTRAWSRAPLAATPSRRLTAAPASPMPPVA